MPDVLSAHQAIIVAPRSVEVRVIDVPAPGAGEVRLATMFSGISAGTEMNVYRGTAPQWSNQRNSETGLFERSDTPEFSYPLAYGYAAVSRVESVGDGVTRLAVGDLVFSYTPHQSYVVVPADQPILLPDLDDPHFGMLMANLNTALNGVLDARIAFGDVVVVSGLGVIGLLITQLARRSGAGTIIGVDRLAHRRELAERFGADITLDPSVGVAEAVRAASGNRGADVVIEVSGAAPALNEAIRTVGLAGRVIAMSWYGGTFESLNLSGEFHHNRPRIISSQVGTISPELGPLWSTSRREQVVKTLLTTLDLAPLFTNEFPIEQAGAAYELVDATSGDLVQCVLTYGSHQ